MYPLEVGVGATWFGIRRTLFAMRDGGMVNSSVEFEIEGGDGPVQQRPGRKISRQIPFLILVCLFELGL